MSAEKLKLSRELNALVSQIKANGLESLAKVKAARRINEIVILLGGSVALPVEEPTKVEDGLSDKTTDENYRWKDTAFIAGARKHMSQTFSEARKEGRNLNTSDIDWDEVGSDMRLAQSLITKENVFGVVDWKALKEAGMPSNVAYLIKRLYTAVDAAPMDQTSPESLRNYVSGISNLREQLEVCRTYDDIRDAVIVLSKKLVRPKYLKEYYKNPAIADNYAPVGVYESRVMSELGDRFFSWMFKSGNKALHECKTNRAPSRKESKGANWEWAKLEPVVKDESGKEVKPRKASFQLEHATDIERIGGTQIDLKSSKELEEMFGFKGIQSGNWVLKDKSSAEFHMKATAEAMLDMSDVLGIDAKHLGLNGNLALAFGARGKGGALAHYEPSTKVINITKMKGGGSLGHEYFHAIDNLVNDLLQGQAGSIKFFATRDYDQIPDEELRAAFKMLNEALLIRKDMFEYKSQYYDLTLPATERQMGFIEQDANQFPRQIGKTLQQVNEMPMADIIIAFESWADDYQKKNMRANVRNVAERFLANYLMYRHFTKGDIPIRPDGTITIPLKGAQSRSSFSHNSALLDDGKTNSYWSKEYEMGARAFSAYLQDRLEEQGRRNDYLAYSTKGGNGRVGEIAYPQGKEREEINNAFDEVFKVIKNKQIFKNASENQQLLDSLFGGQTFGQMIEDVLDNPLAEVERNLSASEMFAGMRGMSGMFDSTNDPDLTINTGKLIVGLLFESGWTVTKNGVWSQAEEQFNIRINANRLYTFDVEIYQNGIFIQNLTTNGVNVQDIVNFINEYIQGVDNKLEYYTYSNADEYDARISRMQSRRNPEEVIQLADVIAQTAATSQINDGEDPTQQQLEANDYKTAKLTIAGMNIAIENPVGSIRKGVDAQGVEWQTQMTAHYGYFDGTLGTDGDELDVFVAVNTPHDYDGKVFIMSQLDQKGNFDEHKVMIGVASDHEAAALYRAHYDEQFNGIGQIVEMTIEQFKARAYTGQTAFFDSLKPMMLDSWAADGRYELLPVKRLDESKLDDQLNEAKATIKEPIVVFMVNSKYYVIHGRKRLEIATSHVEKYVPSIVFDQEDGYTLDDIKNAVRKCGNVVHAEALGAMIEDIASKRLEAELV